MLSMGWAEMGGGGVGVFLAFRIEDLRRERLPAHRFSIDYAAEIGYFLQDSEIDSLIWGIGQEWVVAGLVRCNWSLRILCSNRIDRQLVPFQGFLEMYIVNILHVGLF